MASFFCLSAIRFRKAGNPGIQYQDQGLKRKRELDEACQSTEKEEGVI